MIGRIRRPVETWWLVGLVGFAWGCSEQAAPPAASIAQQDRSAASSTTGSAGSGDVVKTPTQQPDRAEDGEATRPATTGAGPGGAPQVAGNSAEIPFAEEGSPEWRLFEITRLIAPPAPQKEVVGSDGLRELVDRSAEELATERRANLRQVVSHAGRIIVETHANPDEATLFTNAVHYLASAHVELALMGEAENARKLSELAEAVYAESPSSPAAIESAARLVELAQRMGERYGAQDSEWVRAHATQARLFAQRFPLETSRCVTALLDAGRACERVGLHTEARNCYLLLADQFGDTPFADAVVSILRRINLEGTTLAATDFGGPTIDGGFLSIDQYRGRHVLVAFWASDSPTFSQDFPRLQALQEQHGDKLAIIGVNLDLEETAVDQFLEEHPLRWRQVFDTDVSRRGTLNPIASYYGVSTVPIYWLIDPEGKVLAAPAELGNLPLSEVESVKPAQAE